MSVVLGVIGFMFSFVLGVIFGADSINRRATSVGKMEYEGKVYIVKEEK